MKSSLVFTSKRMNEMSGSKDEHSNDDLKSQNNFYDPVCKFGYLTPLQRKKLRERRHIDIAKENIDCERMNKQQTSKKNKKLKNMDKKLHKKSYQVKSKIRPAKKSGKENSVRIQCAIAHIFQKKEVDLKERKFFKALSPNRLEKINYSVPFTGLSRKKNHLEFGSVSKKLLQNHASAENKIKRFQNTCSEDMIFAISDTENCGTNVKNFSQKTVAVPYIVKLSSSNPCKQTRPILKSSTGNDQKSSVSNPEQCEAKFDFEWPSDEVLLQRQRKARAAFRRQTIFKRLHATAENNNNENKLTESSPQKLYPIFHGAALTKTLLDLKRTSPKKIAKHIVGSVKGTGIDQMIIDAGQKEIGTKECSTCNMLYTIGQEEDEKLHTKYHNMYLVNLKFPGWKEENIIGEYFNGRVIIIKHGDKNFMLKKVEDVLEIANRDLGFPTAGLLTRPNVTYLLFISNDKKVVGCLVAESISSAYRVILGTSEATGQQEGSKKQIWKIGSWYSSTEHVPAVCGINRIWVAFDFRRRKIASRMIDCLRCNFLHGYIVGIHELAFTDPSPNGRDFAAAYTGTNNFLVYK